MPHLPRLRKVQKILENMLIMLKPFLTDDLPDEKFHGHMEKFLTCFFLLNNTSLLSEEDKSNIRILVLEYLQKSVKHASMETYDWILLASAWREIFLTHTKPAINILITLRKTLPHVVKFTEDTMKPEQTFLLRQIQKDLNTIFI